MNKNNSRLLTYNNLYLLLLLLCSTQIIQYIQYYMQLKLHNTIQGLVSQKSLKTFRTWKAIHRTPTHLFCEAGLLICCKGNKNLNNCKVSCFETPLFWRYKECYVTRNHPITFGTFGKLAPGPRRTLEKNLRYHPIIFVLSL